MENSQRHDKIVVICGSPDQDLTVQGLLDARWLNINKHTHIKVTPSSFTVPFLSELRDSSKNLPAFLFIVISASSSPNFSLPCQSFLLFLCSYLHGWQLLSTAVIVLSVCLPCPCDSLTFSSVSVSVMFWFAFFPPKWQVPAELKLHHWASFLLQKLIT